MMNFIKHCLSWIPLIAIVFVIHQAHGYFNPSFSLTISDQTHIYKRLAPGKMQTVYRTTNLQTGEFYIGLHRTHKLSDHYIGSGVELHQNIRQYGLPNFHKEILAVYTSEQDMINHECKLINETINQPLSMNLKGC